MFSIKEKTEKGFDKIVLIDNKSGTTVEIIPACGAILHSFAVLHNNALLNIIDNYADKNEFEKQVEDKGFKGCKLSPFVCRVENGRYHFGGENYKIEKFYLGKNSIHGLLYNAVFEITEKNAGEKNAFVEMKYSYRANDKGYPFYYDCIVRYELQNENKLIVSTTIINKDKGYIPVSDGWHPYFGFGGSINDLQLEFQSREILEFDAELIPTHKLIPYHQFGSLKKIGDIFFDNCFSLNFAECQPMLVLRDAAKGMQLEIYPEKSYPFLQIYTPPHRQSIAIENLSSAPDAFNNAIGLITLAPGDKTVFSTTYKISV